MAELDSQAKSIQTLYSWYSGGKLFVNRRYQRKLVWTRLEKQKLVESVLKRYPIPAVLLAERESGGYEVIDGLQRLHTLVSFIENTFPTLEEQYFDVDRFATARSRADAGHFTPVREAEVLTPEEVTVFLDYDLAISVMRRSTEDEIDDVFSRVNTYGHRLSDQERRQAGVQDSFSMLVRETACELRGDASTEILELAKMPSISIDLPMTRHGYSVVADQVFWVNQGILSSTDLRDSMDEQCIADIAACVVSNQLIERSKDALDKIYDEGSPENTRITAALELYGADRFSAELKYCIDELLKVCAAGLQKKLRNIIFAKSSTNPFPSVFTILVLAFHEALIGGQKAITDYEGVKSALSGVYSRIETSRKSTSPEERRKNINSIKGLVSPYLVDVEPPRDLAGAHSTTDIDAIVRRSEIELPHYELKQGILSLSNPRKVNHELLKRVVCTICAIANNGNSREGSILIGVTDKDDHAGRIRELDGIEPHRVGRRYIVGVRREADALNEAPEEYFARWKYAIKNSELSEPLRGMVLSNMDYNDYFGLGVIVITVPLQGELSFVGEDVYWREGDQTVKAEGPRKVAELTKRFS